MNTKRMSRRELRFKRFETFSANLSLYHPELSGVYLCPFCNEYFKREEVDQINPNFLVGAHIVPFTVSHTMRTTMSCFFCDNWFGTFVNSHESRRQALRESRAANRPYRCYARMSNGGREFGISTTIDWNNGGEPILYFNHVIEIPEERRDWFEENARQSVLKPSWDGHELGLDYYGRYVNRRADMSYWHSAYLHMFHHYGYEWAFSPQAQRIMTQFHMLDFPVLNDHFIEPMLLPSSLLTEETLGKRRPSTHVDPSQDGVFVVFPLVKPMDGHIAVYIPRNWDGDAPRFPRTLGEDVTPDHKELAHKKQPLPFND